VNNSAGPRITISLAGALLLLSFRALAQTGDPPPATADPPAANPTVTEASSAPNASSGGELQQVVVTGYLLPRIGEGPQPVTTLDRNYIEKTGSQTITDVLQDLPSALANFNPANTTGFSFFSRRCIYRSQGTAAKRYPDFGGWSSVSAITVSSGYQWCDHQLR
jgi:hypothetical protein